MPRYKITVAYDGTNFHGWQKQQKHVDEIVGEAESSTIEQVAAAGGFEIRSKDEEDWTYYTRRDIRTVQGVVEEAVRQVVREPVNVLGASRTDAGVHARGQVAAFTTQTSIPVERLARAITSRLPDDVQVSDAEIVPEDFDPIQGAIAKGYRYRLAHSCARHRKPLFDRNFITHTAYRLDAVRMNEAARLLMGEHDFSSFTRINHGRDTTVRTIFNCSVTATYRTRCRIDVAGNGFLYNMVRIIAGTLVEVGRGAMEADDIPKIIAARERNAAGPTLPPNGLCLMWIRY